MKCDFDDGTTTVVTCYGYVVSSNVGVMMTIWLCMAEMIINDNVLKNMIAVTTKVV